MCIDDQLDIPLHSVFICLLYATTAGTINVGLIIFYFRILNIFQFLNSKYHFLSSKGNMSRWTTDKSIAFWNNRLFCSIQHDDNVEQRKQTFLQQKQARDANHLHKKQKFLNDFKRHLGNRQLTLMPGSVTSTNLQFWIKHMSWTYCSTCKLLKTEKLLPNYGKRKVLQLFKQCSCQTDIYVNPKIPLIPNVLQGLSSSEIITLRPFTIHLGPYVVKANGYRQKTDMFRLMWSKQAVHDKIECLSDIVSKEKCLNAYSYLMSNDASTYAKFVQLRECEITKNERFNVYDFNFNTGIECALWPNLYPTLEFCETYISATQKHASLKISFLKKVFSEICDYGTSFELLLFHYDLWVFKTVSGAITTARKRYCSPAKALEHKTFSQEYWKWQHRALIDAVKQFGYPSLFITISPSEWSFPRPPWLDQLESLTGRGPTQLAAFETIHIVNTLEQLVRGYLCGSNDGRWKSHFFSYQRLPSRKNILNYFYRFEFQARGTVHIHMLIWLKSIKHIPLDNIRADIPFADQDQAFLVYNLQQSDKDALPFHDGDTDVFVNDKRETLRICHPAEAFAENIRGYISAVLPALRCRMDVQSSNGHGMVLKYVSSYVSKCHDGFKSDCLYTAHTTPYQAAFRHLKEQSILEPEMWLAMSSKKTAWTPHRVKHFTAPYPNMADSCKLLQSYCKRSNVFENNTLLQWLRKVDTSKPSTPPYKEGTTTLVATKLTSVFSDVFYFQDMLLNVPYRQISELLLPNFETLPEPIRYFVCALEFRASLWLDENKVKEHFELEGNKSWFVTNIIFHIRSLKHFHDLWKKQVISITELTCPIIVTHTLDEKQQLVISILKCMLQNRKNHYESINCAIDFFEDEENRDMNEFEDQNVVAPHELSELCRTDENSSIEWTKFLLVVGRAGTGKSFTLMKAIESCILGKLKMMVTTPTGFLATHYKDQFEDEIDSDTVHAAFHYPVLLTEKPHFNWNLCNYDVIVVDEISMIPVKIFEHIYATVCELPIRPVVLLAGDDCQLQPIEKIDGKIQTAKSIMNSKQLANITMKVQLNQQHRNNDDFFEQFLQHIRFWRPSQSLLAKIQQNHVLHEHEPTDDELLQTLIDFPTSTVITVSHRAANRVNNIVLQHMFGDTMLLGYIDSDCQLGKIPVYKSMRIMITQNRNKQLSIVNGRIGVVCQMQGTTVFVKLSNNRIVTLYPVSSVNSEGNISNRVPLMPAYALTIPKAQGITVDQCIVWLDSRTVAPGGAYVALSRCRNHKNIRYMVRMHPEQITPVKFTS